MADEERAQKLMRLYMTLSGAVQQIESAAYTLDDFVSCAMYNYEHCYWLDLLYVFKYIYGRFVMNREVTWTDLYEIYECKHKVNIERLLEETVMEEHEEDNH